MDRKASIAGMDTVTLAKEQRHQERIRSSEKRSEKCEKLSKAQFSEAVLTDSSCSDNERPLASFIPDSKPNKRSHERTAKSGTEAFIPHNILSSPILVALATQIKMTPAEQSAFTEAFVEEAGGDPSQVSTSYSQSAKVRRVVNKKIADEIKKSWVTPKFTSIHWDGKSLPTLQDKYEHEERLAVAVGNSDELKLLGIPAYQSGTDERAGEIISRLTSELLKAWQCSGNVVNMMFDTTSSNTGHMTAACIQIPTAP
ncbi:hypothetical protein SNE40_010835 [Patella caerulea]|uniref:Uncharacterized protein n=1 Tax=Patella caerulea TaxID=87958 RepID=A0AAN8K2S8_PATCE